MSLRTTALAAAAALVLAACGGDKDGDGAAADSAKAGGAAGPAVEDTGGVGGGQGQTAAAVTDNGPKADLPPNEMGRIMVLEYHRIGNNEGEFIRSLEHFRQDLRSLYDKGYRPVTMRDVIDGNINVPAGTTPVVFTFDDSTQGQFYYLPNGQIDPNTMVGSWASFKEQNPGWANGAVWCILPAASHPSNFFSEKKDRDFASREERESNIRKKVTWLVDNGHEICNHTYYHARLDRAKDDQQAQDWIGFGEDSIKAYLPQGYDIVTFALPLGMWPKNHALAWQGRTSKGTTYNNTVVLEVSGGPNVPPWDKSWDPHSVDRFIVAPGALERQLEHWGKDPSNRYVSDGDPNTITVPQRMADRIDRGRVGSRQVKVVPDAAAPAAGGASTPGAAPAAGTSGGG